MTDPQPAAPDLPRPGYYADPAGGPHRRWWNGHAWTEHLEQDAGYVAVGADGRPVQPPIAIDAKVNTPWGWAFALLPVVSLIISLVQLATVDFDQYMRDALAPSDELFPSTTPLEAISSVTSWTLFAAAVVFAALDYRALKKLGVVRPFPWAWTFLFVIPYAIGRGVVLRRRVGRGVAPTWVYLALTAVGLVLGVITLSVMLPAMFDAINSVGFS